MALTNFRFKTEADLNAFNFFRDKTFDMMTALVVPGSRLTDGQAYGVAQTAGECVKALWRYLQDEMPNFGAEPTDDLPLQRPQADANP